MTSEADKKKHTAYMRDYRKRVKELAKTSDEQQLEDMISRYEADGLTRDNLFMDIVYKQALLEKNAKYAEIYEKCV